MEIYGQHGHNQYYQLGTNESYRQYVPTKVVKDENVKFKYVSAGDRHVLALDENNNLWVWGVNYSGQLGDETISEQRYPKQIRSSIKDISAGEYFSLALDTNGNIWSWGDNSSGQLGNNSTTKGNNPQKIETELNTKFKDISAGYNFSLALDIEGNIWSWGDNSSGQLGNNSTTSSLIPQKIQIENQISFKSIAAGCKHSLALDIEGNIWSWGDNSSGQLGNKTYTNSLIPQKIQTEVKFKEISVGLYHNMALDEKGNIWIWGENNAYQIGDGTQSKRYVPIKMEF